MRGFARIGEGGKRRGGQQKNRARERRCNVTEGKLGRKVRRGGTGTADKEREREGRRKWREGE